MKKGFLSFTAFLFALAAVPQAQALVGGPFDNGDYSSTFDNTGIYQAAFRFPNGSGFAQFGTNVDLTLFVDISNTAGTAARGSAYSILNRSLFYYKGVTFLGSATGFVDHDAKQITGYTNGNSDVRTANTSGTSNTGGSQSVAAATSTLISNGGIGLPCNSQWTAKITSSQPILRFHGTGELTVINPSLDQVAYSALVAIISGIQTVAQSADEANVDVGAVIDSLINAVTNPAAQEIIPSLDRIRDNSDTVQMTVFGSRQYFLGRR